MRCDSNETYWNDLRNEADDIITAAACQEMTEEKLDEEVEHYYWLESLGVTPAKIPLEHFKGNF